MPHRYPLPNGVYRVTRKLIVNFPENYSGNCSRDRIVVLESCDLQVLGTGKGEIFITNCPSHVELRGKGQSLWARQLNPEGDSDVGLVRNYGGNLWILGMF